MVLITSFYVSQVRVVLPTILCVAGLFVIDTLYIKRVLKHAGCLQMMVIHVELCDSYLFPFMVY